MISCYIAFLGTFTMSIAITLLLFDQQFQQEWWRFIFAVVLGLGFIFQAFSEILVRRKKLISQRLSIIALALVCLGAIGFSVHS
jgi:heme O synthase-like polyprenyltransferase